MKQQREQGTGIVCRADTESGNGKGDTAGLCQNRCKAEGAAAVQIFVERGEKNREEHMQSFWIEGVFLLMNKRGRNKANLRNIQNSSHKAGGKALNQCVVISEEGIFFKYWYLF